MLVSVILIFVSSESAVHQSGWASEGTDESSSEPAETKRLPCLLGTGQEPKAPYCLSNGEVSPWGKVRRTGFLPGERQGEEGFFPWSNFSHSKEVLSLFPLACKLSAKYRWAEEIGEKLQGIFRAFWKQMGMCVSIFVLNIKLYGFK